MVEPLQPTRPRGQPLDRVFYARDCARVARELLGHYLVRDHGEGQIVARIIETEAYGGALDSASHAYRGPTPRNKPMFGPPGHAYIYLIYGLHELFNIVTEPEGEPGAVLIRAVLPLWGEDAMKALGNGRTYPHLSNGPGKLTRALDISRAALNWHDLCLGRGLWVEAGEPMVQARITTGPRVGVDYARPEHRNAPLRFRLETGTVPQPPVRRGSGSAGRN